MANQNEIYKGTGTVGGGQPLRPNRKFEIQSKDFTSVEQAAPLRVLYGRASVSGLQVTPIWGFRSKAIKTKAGK